MSQKLVSFGCTPLDRQMYPRLGTPVFEYVAEMLSYLQGISYMCLFAFGKIILKIAYLLDASLFTMKQSL